MTSLEALILGLVQGLTEYLPVSSSGHLQIFSSLFGTKAEENLMFTIVLHTATVFSTLVIFRKEILKLLCALFKFQWNEDTQYITKIALSMIPIGIIGVFFKDYVEEIFGSGLLIVGISLLLTSILLSFAYFAKPRLKQKLSYKDSVIIGIAQACAVLPGLSRSGSTIATGIILGNNKDSVAKFSFLMVIVPILGEAFLSLIGGDFSNSAANSISTSALIIGFVTAFVSGYIACKWMLNIVRKGKLIWFAIYCFIVGVIVLFI